LIIKEEDEFKKVVHTFVGQKKSYFLKSRVWIDAWLNLDWIPKM
jgi:hypothetical protein